MAAKDLFWLPFDSYYEPIQRYESGGYHPILIAQSLSGTDREYLILHKLGHGRASTVWLAEDMKTHLYVALKVSTAQASAAAAREAQTLERSREIKNTIKIQGSFTLQGPNGSHVVLVLEVVIPMGRIGYQPAPWRKDVARGLVQGLADLHKQGIIHGDLHLGNVGVAVPTMDVKKLPFSVSDVMERPNPSIVHYGQNKLRKPSHPAYLVQSSDVIGYYNEVNSQRPSMPVTRVYDFGASYSAKESPLLETLPMICSPELAFALARNAKPVRGKPNDIWALGVCLFCLHCDEPPFMGSFSSILSMAVLLAGCVPRDLKFFIPRDVQQQVSMDYAAELWEDHKASLAYTCETEEDAALLVDLLKKIFVFDVKSRPTSDQVLKHPWFTGPVDVGGVCLGLS